MEPQSMTQSEKEIRDIIATKNLNLFVEAGAGAGKTSMLSLRIVNQILNQEPLNSFVIITFTKAAAQELLDRIVQELRKAAQSNKYNDLQKQLLNYAILHIDEMQVSTIHSFCRRILLENAFESGFVMDAQMIEDDEVEQRKKNFFKKWKREHKAIIKQLDENETDEKINWYGSLYDAFSSIATLRDPIVLPNPTSLEAIHAQSYMNIAIQIAKDYQAQEDQETKILTNDQLLYKANRMVMTNETARKKLRNQFKHFYVDEFQDTDNLQADMIWTLASNEDGTLRENALFLVGDPKQSIYRFRGAQVNVFNEIKARMEQLPNDLAMTYELTQNFRSNYQLIQGWINPTFQNILGNSYTDMRSAKEEKGIFNGSYRLPMSINEDTGKLNSEIKSIVELVQRMVQVVPNEVSYKDFLIILRNTSKVTDYVDAFSKVNIPVAVRAKMKVNNNDLLKNFIDIYVGLIDHSPLAQAKMITALSGQVYARLSDEQIQEYLNYIHTFAEESGFNESTPYGAAKILYNHFDVYAKRDKAFDKVTLRSAKIKIMQCIDTMNQTVQGTKESYASAMQDYFENEIKRETPLSATEDAVQIMNVHQTKGLAGKIVIIAQRKQAAKKDERRYDNLKTDDGIYPVFNYDNGSPFNRPKAITYLDYPELLELDLREQDDELKRLEYVAATRVRQTLIFSEEQSEHGWFPENSYEISKLPDINERILEIETQQKQQLNQNNALDDDNLANVLSNTNLTSLSSKQYDSVSPSDFESNGISGYAPNDEGYVKENRPQGNVFGTVLHRVYELLIDHRDAWLNKENDTLISILIQQAINESEDAISEEERPFYYSFLLSKMQFYTKHVLPDILKDAVNVYPEYPFAFTLEKDDAKPSFLDQEVPIIYVNGTMDLVVEYADHFVIYDYKSDAMSGMDKDTFQKRMQRKYAKQLEFYQFALSKQTGNTKITTKLINLYCDK